MYGNFHFRAKSHSPMSSPKAAPWLARPPPDIKQLDPRETVHERVQEVLLGFVEDAVAEPGADNGGEHAVQKSGVDQPRIKPFATHHPREDPQAGEQGDGPQNTVPGYLKAPERKGDGVDVPLDEKLSHNDPLYNFLR